MKNLESLLNEFSEENAMKGKGPLCVALVITREAIRTGLPLNAEDLITEGQGQVAGLNKSAVQSILKDYGIERVLAEEGGRTSRGSMGNMKKYVSFLNSMPELTKTDLNKVEAWWIDRVKAFFSAKPIILRFDASKSLGAIIKDLIDEAEKRQGKTAGSMLVGAMLQHLVGAKLSIILDYKIEHRGASVADESSGQQGDFVVKDVAIHVTTAPNEALIRKCKRNLDSGLRPLIFTTHTGVTLAEGLAAQSEIAERIDCFEIEQFLAGNIYERGEFAQAGHRLTAEILIKEYNKIIDICETDPSLRIEIIK